jgi:type VI secretion system secreted protein Hcp
MSISITKRLSLTALVAMLIAIPVHSMAALDMYLKFDNVKGDSVDDGHKDWIDVLAWSWGLSTNGKGKTCVQNLSVTKYIDSSTDDLIQAIPANMVFNRAQLVVKRAGEQQIDYIALDMSGVAITSVSTGGSGGEDRLTENVTFSFTELTGKFTPQNQNGTAAPPQDFVVPAEKCN